MRIAALLAFLSSALGFFSALPQITLIVLVVCAVFFGLPTPWGDLNIDFFPIAIRLLK